MRTTLIIDDDVLSAAKEMAASERRSVGEVISSLAKRALSSTASSRKTRNGLPPRSMYVKAPQGNSGVSPSTARGVAVTRFLLHINVLIALIDPAHVQHGRVHEWSRRAARRPGQPPRSRRTVFCVSRSCPIPELCGHSRRSCRVAGILARFARP